jgi:hypothetical protein
MEDREERREDGEEDENMIKDREERLGSFFHAQYNSTSPYPKQFAV